MPGSASQDQDGALRLSIFSEGVQDTSVAIVSITIRHALNRISWAELVIDDGDMPTGAFPLSEKESFIPGKAIRIQAGYGSNASEVFSGIVVRHGIKIDAANRSSLVVECRDPACKMTIGRKNANYISQTDSDIIKAMLGKYGLTADVQSTSVIHTGLVQYYCSDWDFMLARADANGLLVQLDGSKVSVNPPKMDAEPVLTVTWGVDLYAFNADIDARLQLTTAQATSWDPKSQAILQGSPAQPAALKQGNLTGNVLAEVASPGTFALQTSAPQEQAFLTEWAKAIQQRAALARICGQMRIVGNAKVTPGCLVSVQGVGTRFNGSVFVSAVEHTMQGGAWLSNVEFGLNPAWHVTRDDVVAPANGGLLPGVGGLQIGVVLKLDGDPAGEQRIQVKLPVLQAETEGIWARLLQGYASNGFGCFFLPEIGDEVLIGYLNDDPCHPVVLGSLYSSAHPPAYALAAENKTKAISTRALHKIEFNEEDKIITITTPGNNKVVLDDKNKSVLLQDQNNNSVTLSDSGIVLNSPKDIQLTAKGKVTISAVNTITLDAKADVKVAGLNINCEAQVGFVGKGSATAELSAAGQTTVKGAMVMIN